MNITTNDMTWDAIAKYEGSEIKTISATEIAEVNGGIWVPVFRAIVQAIKWGGAAYGAGYLAQKGANHANGH